MSEPRRSAIDFGLPKQLKESADDLRGVGFDDLAEGLERAAERAREELKA